MRTVKLPRFPVEGGCQCGRLRYRLTAKPLMFYLCHCTECQRHTSSAFGESLRCRSADVELSGPQRTVTRAAESGRIREGVFCPDCGVRVWHGSRGMDIGNIKAGTLDDTSWLVPAGHIWTRSKQPFVVIADDELSWQQQPGDGYEAIRKRWEEMTA
ncbi:MAG: aldehyde-activating protein [Phyllobacteriaceae bacterium]|nr:aldehyde-activating protein [Phyllobacteriaceae bacterium]MBA92166.1 aldehyde-activating protein [Phyllobacteriaceae bacterium]